MQTSARDVEKLLKIIETSNQLTYLNLASLPLNSNSFKSLLLMIKRSKQMIHLDLTQCQISKSDALELAVYI